MRAGTPSHSSTWQTRIAWSLLAVAPLLLIAPLLWAGKLPRGADLTFHAQLADGFLEGLRTGAWYPRWLLDANAGFGSPAPINYPPLGSYLVAIPRLLGTSALTAWLIALGLSAYAAAWAFYAWARDHVAPIAAACFATLYTLSPYHALNLYDRFAFAELNAFVWLPLIVRYQQRLHRGGSERDALGFTLSFAGLLFTHILTAYLALLFIALYALAAPTVGPRWRAWAITALAGVSACVLSVVYLGPLLVEAQQTHPEYFTIAHWSAWARNFVFDDERARGFKRGRIKPIVNQSMVWLMTAWWVAAFVLWRARRGWLARGEHARWTEVCVWLLACLIAVLLQLPLSAPVWEHVPQLDKVCFPWRLQTFQTLLSVMLLALAWGATSSRGLRGVIVLIALAGVALSSSYVTRSKHNIDEAALLAAGIKRAVQPEHIPRDVRPWPRFPGKEATPIRKRAETTHKSKLKVLVWEPELRTVRVKTKQATRLRLHTFAFPGWQATLDGHAVPVRPDTHFRLLAIDVPAGTHHATFTLRDTPVRRYSEWLSALAALGLLGLTLGLRQRPAGHQ